MTNRGLEVLTSWRPDQQGAVPPYEQLRQLIAAMAAGGELPVGTRLPSVRALAQEASLAANTVARAFRELERSGVLRTAGRKGTVIAADGNTSRAQVAQAAADFAAVVHGQGMAADEALGIAAAALAAADPGSAAGPTAGPVAGRS